MRSRGHAALRHAHDADPEILDALLTHIPELWAATSTSSGTPSTATRDAWDGLCRIGVAGLLVPSRQGGQGANLCSAVSVAWSLSRLPAPVPFLSTAVMAASFAVALGDLSLLTEIATGDAVCAVAAGAYIHEERSAVSVHGEVGDVLHGGDANRWLVLGETEDADTVLVVVDRPPASIECTSEPTRPTYRACFAGTPARKLADGVTSVAHDVVRRAHVVRCAEILAAADVVAGEDVVLRRAVDGAMTAVRSAAAVADLHGVCDPVPVEIARARTAAVAKSIRWHHHTPSVRTELCIRRATADHRWLPDVEGQRSTVPRDFRKILLANERTS